MKRIALIAFIAAGVAKGQLLPTFEVAYATYSAGANIVQRDAAGNLILIGATASDGLAGTTGSLQPLRSQGKDVFVVKLDPTGTQLLWATYLGGSGDDMPSAVALDASGNIYIAGSTNSPDFPLAGSTLLKPSSPTMAGIFLSKISSNGTRLIYSGLVSFGIPR